MVVRLSKTPAASQKYTFKYFRKLRLHNATWGQEGRVRVFLWSTELLALLSRKCRTVQEEKRSVRKTTNLKLSDSSVSKYSSKYLNKVIIICLVTSLITAKLICHLTCPLITKHKLTTCYFGPGIFKSCARQGHHFHKTQYTISFSFSAATDLTAPFFWCCY